MWSGRASSVVPSAPMNGMTYLCTSSAYDPARRMGTGCVDLLTSAVLLARSSLRIARSFSTEPRP